MKKAIVSVISVLALLLALAALGIWWFETKSLPVFFATDAVHFLAYEASDMFADNPATTQDELDRMIRFHHEASNINLKIDHNGKAVDPFGTPFRIEHEAQSDGSITTVTSAGPDRRFGTRDDLAFRHERKTGPSQSPPMTAADAAPLSNR